jgi:glutathione synthase/RimK-type ligase-like ATP-grasp enzyme
MKVGILESRDDIFINDVISKLSGVEVEFLSFRQQAAPISGDHRVIVDRASFCHTFLKEIMKNLALSGTYIINNPFSSTVTNKLIDIGIGRTLGISFPKTFALPGANLTEETEEWIGEPLWEQIIDEVGLPCILKPFDGYAWTNVYTANSLDELKQSYYSISPGQVMLVQKLIRYTDYYRTFCLSKKDVLFAKWIPKPFSMGQYIYSDLKPIENIKDTLTRLTIDLNTCLDLDVNAVEWCLDKDGHPWIIDALNEVPEINKEALPEEYYNWIVQKFVACIEDKLDSNQRNKTVFLLQEELADKVFRIHPPTNLKT